MFPAVRETGLFDRYCQVVATGVHPDDRSATVAAIEALSAGSVYMVSSREGSDI